MRQRTFIPKSKKKREKKKLVRHDDDDDDPRNDEKGGRRKEEKTRLKGQKDEGGGGGSGGIPPFPLIIIITTHTHCDWLCACPGDVYIAGRPRTFDKKERPVFFYFIFSLVGYFFLSFWLSKTNWFRKETND